MLLSWGTEQRVGEGFPLILVRIIAHCPAFEKSITVNLGKVHKSETIFVRFDGERPKKRKSDKTSYGQDGGRWCTIIPGSFPISHPLEPCPVTVDAAPFYLTGKKLTVFVMSLRGGQSPTRQSVFFFASIRFPRQCEHWLGMTGSCGPSGTPAPTFSCR